MAEIKDSGERTQFQSGAVRDMHEGKGRCDLLPMCVMLRLARHYEAGAKKYDDRNWEKGIPAHSFADSALAWTEEKRPDMMDIPARMENADGNGR